MSCNYLLKHGFSFGLFGWIFNSTWISGLTAIVILPLVSVRSSTLDSSWCLYMNWRPWASWKAKSLTSVYHSGTSQCECPSVRPCLHIGIKVTPSWSSVWGGGGRGITVEFRKWCLGFVLSFCLAGRAKASAVEHWGNFHFWPTPSSSR